MTASSSHFDASGQARMVDVGSKAISDREAVAHACVRLSREAYDAVARGTARKGDVLGVARIAGIQAAKRTADWIPLCHPLAIETASVDFHLDPERLEIEIEARVAVAGKTGVEMEALVAVAAAGLTIYDMCKSIDRSIRIEALELVRKSGGKSGLFERSRRV